MSEQGERYAAARVHAGYTQAQMARILGVRQETISRWETGANEPKASDLRRMAIACGVSADELLDVDYDPVHLERRAQIGAALRALNRLLGVGDVRGDASAGDMLDPHTEKSRFLQRPVEALAA